MHRDLKHGVSRKGANRSLIVRKASGKATLSDVHTVSLDGVSHDALLQHYNRFPVTEDEMTMALAGNEATVSAATAAAGGSAPQRSSGAAFTPLL